MLVSTVDTCSCVDLRIFLEKSHNFFMKVDSDSRSIRVLLSDAVILLPAVVFSTLQTTPEIPPSLDLDAPRELHQLIWVAIP